MDPVVDGLIQEMHSVFGDDRKRIDHALAVLGHANRLRAVEGGDPLVIQAAAVLHDIGIHEAERKHGSAAGRYQEIEGPPMAEAILRRRGVGDDSSRTCVESSPITTVPGTSTRWNSGSSGMPTGS